MITIWSSTQPNASSGLTNWTSWGTELVHTALGHWRIGFALSATFPNLGLVNFYDRFIPHCASLLEPVNRLLKTSGDSTRQFIWDESAATAFTTIRRPRCCYSVGAPQITRLHVHHGRRLRLGSGSSPPEGWQLFAYFSKKLRPAETKYSTFNRELLAIYLAISHFHYFIQGREFFVLTDHKPLTFALSTHSDRFSPRQARHLDQFTTDIRHVGGGANPVGDALSRATVSSFQVPPPKVVDFEAMAAAQIGDQEALPRQ